MTVNVDNIEIGDADPKAARPEAESDEGRLFGVLSKRPRLARLFDPHIVSDVYMVLEATLILGLGVLLAKIYVGGQLGVTNYVYHYAAPVVIFVLLVVVFLRNKGLYQLDRLSKFSSSIGDTGRSFVEAFVCLVMLGFVLGVANDYSRVWLVGWFGSSVALVLLLRAVASHVCSWLVQSGRVLKTTAIYGSGAQSSELAAQLADAGTGIGVVGLFGPAETFSGPERHAYAGDTSDLIAYGQAEHLDAVLIDARSLSADELDDALAALSVLPVEVQVHTRFGKGPTRINSISHVDGLALFDVQRRPISRWAHVVKSIEDYTIASIAVVALAPLVALIALAIKIDSPGPVLFSQRRHGFNHKIFRVWKFRTMRVMEDGEECVQAVRNDSRVTRVGAFLRRTSMDELPQLLNVLAGDMSIVGPRPHPLNLNSKYDGLVERYGNRHKVKPGITGLAQIYGFRGPTEDAYAMQKRVEYDLRYIENWSIWLDIKILAATPFLGIINKNAF